MPETAEMMDNNELIGEFDGEIICETPNNVLNKFDGILTWKGNKYVKKIKRKLNKFIIILSIFFF